MPYYKKKKLNQDKIWIRIRGTEMLAMFVAANNQVQVALVI